MKKNNPLLRKNLFRLILLVCISILPISLSAQTTEHLTGETDGGIGFSEDGATFSLTGSYLKVENYTEYGWTGSAIDNFYIDNIDMPMSSAGVIGSIKNLTKNFYVHEMYLAPGDASFMIGKYGDVIIRGKLGGVTQFTYTLLSANINNNNPVIINNSYTYVNLSSYNTILINELEFELTAGLRYLAIDAFKFSIPVPNSAPTNIALSASAINENVVGNSTVGTLSSTDPDAGNTFTYTLVAGAGDTDNASFNISGSSLQITGSPDYETKNSYSVRVRTTDQGSLTYEKTFTVTINNLNEAPSNFALSASAINENVAGNSTVGTLSSTDPDAGNTFTYSLVAGAGDTDNASFNISGSSLQITGSPDYETKNSYSVRVRTTDQGSLTYEKTFTVTINNLNEAPSNLALSASAINENVAGNSTVGTLSSTDADAANTFTYTLVAGAGDTDNASFNISGSILQITGSPDYETKNSYSVRLRTTDQGSLTYEKTFTVTINNLNEAPSNLALSASAINENVAGNSTVGTLSSTDADAANTFTYTLVAGAGDTDNASFNISGSSLLITGSPDYETKNSYSVRVRTTDQGSLTYEKTFTVTINNLNEAAVVTTQAVMSIASTTATGNGNITNLGSPNPTAYGVCWNTGGTPTTSNSKDDKGATSSTGAFTASITGLIPNTTYYVRAFATNTSGTVYGDEVNFTTAEATASTYSGTGDWTNSGNWSDGIPGLGTTATIVGNVTLSSSTTVEAITINASSSLTVAVGQTLTVSNGVTNNGTISNNGTIVGEIMVPITFDENGGTLVSDLTQNFNTALTLPTPTKNSYDFMGWYSDISLNTEFTATTMPLNGLTLYAKWQLATSLISSQSESVIVYPNPSTNYIYVNVGTKSTPVDIFDMNGSIVISAEITESNSIDISNLENGVYILKTNGKMVKVIKQ